MNVHVTLALSAEKMTSQANAHVVMHLVLQVCNFLCSCQKVLLHMCSIHDFARINRLFFYTISPEDGELHDLGVNCYV